jgi:hypothetical protein
MADEAKLRSDVLAGARAQAIIESEDFRAACDRVTARFINKWKSEPRSEERDRIWMLLQALNQIQIELTSTASDGVVAASMLEQ